MQSEGAEKFVERAFSDYSYEKFTPKYNCLCSKEYIDKILLTMGETELYDIVEKEGKIEVHCHFCNTKYVYYKNDVDKLLNNVTNNG